MSKKTKKKASRGDSPSASAKAEAEAKRVRDEHDEADRQRNAQLTADKAKDDDLCARLDAEQKAFAKKTEDAAKAESEAMHKPAQSPDPEGKPDAPAKHWWNR